MKKRSIILISIFFLLGSMLLALPKEKVYAQEESGWIATKKKAPVGYDLTSYEEDPDISFYLKDENKTFTLATASLRKGDEVWVPLREVAEKLGLLYLEPRRNSIVIIREDGTPLEMEVGKKEALVNKAPFLMMPDPLSRYNDTFMLSLESLNKALTVYLDYNINTNTVTIAREDKKSFKAFKIEKPPEVIQREKETKIAAPKKEGPDLPRDMREELLPSQYGPDVALDLDTSFRYYHDMLGHKRTRYNEYFLNGKVYGVDVYGHLSMRDFENADKSRFKEDAQHISFFKDGSGIKLLDNYFTLPRLRSQSQPYWGIEIDDEQAPADTRVWIGEADPVSVSTTEGTGTVKYYGNLYASQQDWIETDKFRLSAMEMFIYNYPEYDTDQGKTNYPRNNFLYLLDSDWYIWPDVNFYNTFAQSTHNPDNKPDLAVTDYDIRSGTRLQHERFNFDTYVEYIGDKYASVGIPSSYQDFMGWNLSSNFKIAKELYAYFSCLVNRDNVAYSSVVPTTHSRGMNVGTTWNLPWEQSLTFNYGYNRWLTRGGNQDATGNEYYNYRLDYYKNFGTTTSLQLGYNYYRMDPLATSTGSFYYHTYSGTIYKSFPSLNGSYIRFYQDLTKRKELSMGSAPTVNTWNTTLSARYYILPYLSFTAESRLVTTQRDDMDDSSVLSLTGGVDYNAGPDTFISFVYEVGNMELFDKYRSTKDWSFLFTVRQIFDLRTPEKWGRVKVRVFEDLNGNDTLDPEEKGMPDVLTYVVNGRGEKTDWVGGALIQKVVPGERKVRIDMRNLPVEMVIKGNPAKDIEVKPLKTSEVTFIMVTTGKVKGRVFVDVDENGVYEKGVDIPLPNIRVMLDPIKMVTLTFSDGTYQFDFVYPGSYEVKVGTKGLPIEYILSSPDTVPIEVKSKETTEDIDFTAKGRPIKVQYF